MRVDVKICGIRTFEALDAAIEAGVDAIGLVLADSPRRVDADVARRLLARVPESVVRVAVVRRPGREEIAAVRDLPFDVVQADANDVVPVELPVLRAFYDAPDLLERLVQAGFGPSEARRPDPWRHGFLVDGPLGGGRGVPADLDRARAAAELGALVLAGGLRPASVLDAVLHVRPRAVDVSSGVESAPGVKDAALIRAFVEAVHQAEARASIEVSP